MPKGKLKAKGTVTQGTRVEEPRGPDHQFLCTREVGTPKASFNWGNTPHSHHNHKYNLSEHPETEITLKWIFAEPSFIEYHP